MAVRVWGQMPSKFCIVKKVLVQFFFSKIQNLKQKLYISGNLGAKLKLWTNTSSVWNLHLPVGKMQILATNPCCHWFHFQFPKCGRAVFHRPVDRKAGPSAIPNKIWTSVSWDWTSAPRDCISVSKDSNSTPYRSPAILPIDYWVQNRTRQKSILQYVPHCWACLEAQITLQAAELPISPVNYPHLVAIRHSVRKRGGLILPPELFKNFVCHIKCTKFVKIRLLF